MKAIILAAGEGKRLRPLTNEIPKCMVKYNDKPIIDHIIETMQKCNIDDITVVNGYKKDTLEAHLNTQNISFFTNKNFDKTNMVSTLFCAQDFMDDDLIISYADIVYDEEVLVRLLKSEGDFNVVVDRKWKELWRQRMDNPLDDAETLKIQNGKIIELGKKPITYDDIEGQYIGLIRISSKIIKKVINFYEGLDRNKHYDGKDFSNMYMTSFIQMVIDDLCDVEPVFIDGGWVEIDCVDDLSVSKFKDKKANV